MYGNLENMISYKVLATVVILVSTILKLFSAYTYLAC